MTYGLLFCRFKARKSPASVTAPPGLIKKEMLLICETLKSSYVTRLFYTITPACQYKFNIPP